MIKADRWRPSDGMQLEPNALRAAREAVHSLAVTAGPGAGKTELLAQRADFLLRTGTSPYPRSLSRWMRRATSRTAYGAVVDLNWLHGWTATRFMPFQSA